MFITVTDPTLLAQLMADDRVELRDPSGRVLGVFIPDSLGRLPPGDGGHGPFGASVF